MTPVPSSPVALLDQLDELRAKATPGPWHVMKSAAGDHWSYVITGERVVTDPGCLPADAALIVAAVNTVGPLTAAVRAVLELMDPENGMATGNGYDATRLFDERDIRKALTAALSVTA